MWSIFDCTAHYKERNNHLAEDHNPFFKSFSAHNEIDPRGRKTGLGIEC